jgi:quercetin dioxygenase-like cupin family protein
MVVAANIVTEKDGIPVLYGGAQRVFGVRVIHQQNPKARSKNFSCTIVYIAPGGMLDPHTHENEEAYIVLEGEGKGFFGQGKPIDIKPGMFMHLPPNAEHGVENTGDKIMKLLLCTSPQLPPMPIWKL